VRQLLVQMAEAREVAARQCDRAVSWHESRDEPDRGWPPAPPARRPDPGLQV